MEKRDRAQIERYLKRKDQLMSVIRDATGVVPDTEVYTQLLLNSEEPLWSHPVLARRDVDRLKARGRALRRELSAFQRKWTEKPFREFSDPGAVPDTIAALNRIELHLDDVFEKVAALRTELEEYEGKKITKRRDWRRYMLALAAATIFNDLTGDWPAYSKSKKDPFRNMVLAIYDHFELSVRDVDGPIKWATEEPERESPSIL